MNKECDLLHNIFNNSKIYRYPFNINEIPRNGIYIMYEDGEFGHGGNRIVRVGTHTGQNQLRSRIRQHYEKENKNRSIFRKNIGRCILSDDSYLHYWNKDITSKKDKDLYTNYIDKEKEEIIEKHITQFIQNNISFSVIEIESKEKRLELESKIISTISYCDECKPSPKWLGLKSPKQKICESGLWLVNELWKEKLTSSDLDFIKENLYKNSLKPIENILKE